MNMDMNIGIFTYTKEAHDAYRHMCVHVRGVIGETQHGVPQATPEVVV